MPRRAGPSGTSERSATPSLCCCRGSRATAPRRDETSPQLAAVVEPRPRTRPRSAASLRPAGAVLPTPRPAPVDRSASRRRGSRRSRRRAPAPLPPARREWLSWRVPTREAMTRRCPKWVSGCLSSGALELERTRATRPLPARADLVDSMRCRSASAARIHRGASSSSVSRQTRPPLIAIEPPTALPASSTFNRRALLGAAIACTKPGHSRRPTTDHLRAIARLLNHDRVQLLCLSALIYGMQSRLRPQFTGMPPCPSCSSHRPHRSSPRGGHLAFAARIRRPKRRPRRIGSVASPRPRGRARSRSTRPGSGLLCRPRRDALGSVRHTVPRGAPDRRGSAQQLNAESVDAQPECHMWVIASLPSALAASRTAGRRRRRRISSRSGTRTTFASPVRRSSSARPSRPRVVTDALPSGLKYYPALLNPALANARSAPSDRLPRRSCTLT